MRTSKNISRFIRETVRKLMQIGHKGVYEFIEYMEILQYGHQFEVNKLRSDVLVAGFEHYLVVISTAIAINVLHYSL